MPVHAAEEGGGTFHGLHHLLVGPHRLDAEAYGLELGAHGVKFLYIPIAAGKCINLADTPENGYPLQRRAEDKPPRSNQIFGLDLAGAHLPIFGALFNVLNQFLLLVLKLNTFAVEFALGLFESSLVFSETFLGGHTFAKGPFDDLGFVRIEGLWKGFWEPYLRSYLYVRGASKYSGFCEWCKCN